MAMDEKDLIINEMAALNANQAITIASLKATLTIQQQQFQAQLNEAGEAGEEPEKPEFPDHKAKRTPVKKTS